MDEIDSSFYLLRNTIFVKKVVLTFESSLCIFKSIYSKVTKSQRKRLGKIMQGSGFISSKAVD